MKLRCAVLLLIALTIAAPALLRAQHAPSHPPRVYTSADGTFHFQYAQTLVRCNANPNGQTDDSCASYIPVCTESAFDPSDTVVCIAYPAGSLKKNTNFSAAAFAVSVIKEAPNEGACLSFSLGDAENSSSTAKINGVEFKLTETDGGGMGHLMEGYVYRAFHDGRCYELGIRTSYTNIGMYDPGTVKEFNHGSVHSALKAVLESFEFLKRK